MHQVTACVICCSGALQMHFHSSIVRLAYQHRGGRDLCVLWATSLRANLSSRMNELLCPCSMPPRGHSDEQWVQLWLGPYGCIMMDSLGCNCFKPSEVLFVLCSALVMQQFFPLA